MPQAERNNKIVKASSPNKPTYLFKDIGNKSHARTDSRVDGNNTAWAVFVSWKSSIYAAKGDRINELVRILHSYGKYAIGCDKQNPWPCQDDFQKIRMPGDLPKEGHETEEIELADRLSGSINMSDARAASTDTYFRCKNCLEDTEDKWTKRRF